MKLIEYRPDAYHLGEMDHSVKRGCVETTKDGKRKVTQDGGIWAVDAKEKYHDYEDVLRVDANAFEVEEVGEAMLSQMQSQVDEASPNAFPVPLHYGTLVSRATIEFGWEPFLLAAALEPEKFSKILNRFAEASLAVISGWTKIKEVELIIIHDDIASTKGLIFHPDWLRKYVFPWHKKMFRTVREAGKKVLYISDGNYIDVMDDILANEPDGLFVESMSMDPEVIMRRAGREKLYLVKTNPQFVDHGKPEEIYNEMKNLRRLHEEYHGMIIYSGNGGICLENEKLFEEYYKELLVY